MCSPAFIPLALGVVGGISKGNQEEAQARDQANQMNDNAKRSFATAADVLNTGRVDADWQRVKTGQAVSEQRVAQAANGGVVDQDSNAQLNQDVAMLGELDAQRISNNAARSAYGYQVQAVDLMSNANRTIQAGANAKKNSILGGIAQGASGYAAAGGGFSNPFGGSSSSGFISSVQASQM